MYAVGYEKKLCYRSLGFGMELSERSTVRATEEGQNTYPLPTRYLRRHLLRPQKRLSLAIVAPRFPALADGFLPFSPISPERDVAPYLHDSAWDGEKEGRQEPQRLRSSSWIPSLSKPPRSAEKTEARSFYDAQGNGYDAHKNVKGRKRHLLVDTLGLPLSVYVSPADTHDRVGARWLLSGGKLLLPRLKKIWADGAYSGDPLSQWCQQEGGWELEIVERDKEVCGFEVIPKRWIVERTISWIGQNCRMSLWITSGRYRQARRSSR